MRLAGGGRAGDRLPRPVLDQRVAALQCSLRVVRRQHERKPVKLRAPAFQVGAGGTGGGADQDEVVRARPFARGGVRAAAAGAELAQQLVQPPAVAGDVLCRRPRELRERRGRAGGPRAWSARGDDGRPARRRRGRRSGRPGPPPRRRGSGSSTRPRRRRRSACGRCGGRPTRSPGRGAARPSGTAPRRRTRTGRRASRRRGRRSRPRPRRTPPARAGRRRSPARRAGPGRGRTPIRSAPPSRAAGAREDVVTRFAALAGDDADNPRERGTREPLLRLEQTVGGEPAAQTLELDQKIALALNPQLRDVEAERRRRDALPG